MKNGPKDTAPNRTDVIQHACLDRVLFKGSQNVFQAIHQNNSYFEKSLPELQPLFFLFCFLNFLSPETFGCNFIQRFKSFQFIGYNIETFISCFSYPNCVVLPPISPRKQHCSLNGKKTKSTKNKCHVSSRGIP